MATKTRKQTTKGSRRSVRSRGSRQPGGAMGGLLNQITDRIGGSRGRGGAKRGGLASQASGLVRGFLRGGGRSSRRRR